MRRQAPLTLILFCFTTLTVGSVSKADESRGGTDLSVPLKRNISIDRQIASVDEGQNSVCIRSAQARTKDIIPTIASFLLSDKVGIAEGTLYVNKTDAMLYRFTARSGEQFTLYGRRDTSGSATGVTMFDYVDKSGAAYTIFNDQYGVPYKVIDAQGLTVEFDYQFTETSPVEAVVSKDSNTVDATMRTGPILVTLSQPGSPAVQLTLSLQPLSVGKDQQIAEWHATKPTGNVYVDVNACYEQAAPQGGVLVNFRTGNRKRVERYPAEPTGNPGEYVASVPKRQQSSGPGTVEQMCTAVADKIDSVCKVFNPIISGPGANFLSDPANQLAICGTLGVSLGELSIALAPITGGGSLSAIPAVPGVTAGCTALLAGTTRMCNTFGYSFYGDHPTADNITQMLCKFESNASFLDSLSGIDTASLQAVADFSQGASWGAAGSNVNVFTSQETEVSAFGPFPRLNVHSGKPLIRELATDPDKPEGGQDYSVVSNQYCTHQTQISVSRDGSTMANASEYAPFNSDGNYSFQVNVSGSPTGNVDIVKAVARDADNKYPVEKQKVIYYPPAIPDYDYVVWYMDNVQCWDAPRVYATSKSDFEKEEATCNIPGGGINCDIKVKKVKIGGGNTLQEAQESFCSQITTRWYHYWCNHRGPRVEIGGGKLYTLQIPCDLSNVPYKYP